MKPRTDKLAGTFEKDKDYLKFVEELSKPVEKPKSAEALVSLNTRAVAMHCGSVPCVCVARARLSRVCRWPYIDGARQWINCQL